MFAFLIALSVGCRDKIEVPLDDTAVDSGDPACTPADELCDGVDNDCDGLVDGEDDSLIGAPTWYADVDGDGYGDPADPRIACDAPLGTVPDSDDCDDVDPTINPDADEICNDVDDDCDSLVDGQDDSLAGAPIWHADIDGDGFGGEATGEIACDAPLGTVPDSDDCDDVDPAINPAADEICNDVDDDCDGLVDGQDDSLIGAPTWYGDADGDGFGDPGDPRVACHAPLHTVADSQDCEDDDLTVNPAEAEWEYAARAGEDTTYSGSEALRDVAWFSLNSGGRSHEICGRDPNGWGFCDMTGNLDEVTGDVYAPYDSAAATDPSGPASGATRVIRGGYFNHASTYQQVGYRMDEWPDSNWQGLGLRLARTVP